MKHASRVKSSLASEMLTAMKSRNVESNTKVAHGLVPYSVVTDSFAEKGKSTHMGTSEKSTELGSEEFPKVYVLLKADLIEDIDAWLSLLIVLGM